jgi:peptide/nickel transport system permease protein
MLQYTIRRLLLAIPVLIGILVVTFILARMIPGDPCKAMLGERASAEVCARFNAANGLDEPVTTQFAIYMSNIIQGDFGNSIRFSRPVMTILIERLPLTIELGTTALIIAILIGIPAGILAAVKRNSIWDVITMVGANIGVSMPVYWLGLMLAYVFALMLRGTPLWLPPSGRLTAGLSAIPFYQVWGWDVTAGTFIAGALDFFSNMYLLNSILIQDWVVLGDAVSAT